MSFTIKEGNEQAAISFEREIDAQSFADELNEECGVQRYRVVTEYTVERINSTTVRDREHLSLLLDQACIA